MHAHLHLREHIVLGLGLARDLNLLEAHGDGCGRHVDARDQDLEARREDAGESSAALENLPMGSGGAKGEQPSNNDFFGV